MIKKSFFVAFLACLLAALLPLCSYASVKMAVGVDTAGIFNSSTLSGVPKEQKHLGDTLTVESAGGSIMAVLGANGIIYGYCDKNQLIMPDSVYFAQLPVRVFAGQYSALVDSAKYLHLFGTPGLDFVNTDGRPMLIQQETFLKLSGLASQLEASGYKLVVERAYTYSDENGTQLYATGSRLDISLYTGDLKIDIPKSTYDPDGNVIEYSELEQIFLDHGFIRIDSSSTFEDENTASYLPYEVDFLNLPYVIIQ